MAGRVRTSVALRAALSGVPSNSLSWLTASALVAAVSGWHLSKLNRTAAAAEEADGQQAEAEPDQGDGHDEERQGQVRAQVGEGQFRDRDENERGIDERQGDVGEVVGAVRGQQAALPREKAAGDEAEHAQDLEEEHHEFLSL